MMAEAIHSYTLAAIAATGFVALDVSKALAVQPTVTLPSGLNLGATSFYDGFGGQQPGDSAWQTYIAYAQNKGLKDSAGKDIPIFNDPKMDVYSVINQYSYLFKTDQKILGGHLGVDFIVPMASLDASFQDAPPFPGIKLKDNGAGLGDPTVSLFVQSDPITLNGNPFFVSRLNIGVTMPAGKYDNDVDFNIGNNFWSVHSYWAMTFLLGPEWSISLRPQYYYNFKNSDPASSLPLDQGVEDTQAGQSVSLNYNVAYKVNNYLTLGVSGYYLKQITDHQINGLSISDSKEKAIGFGPGLMVELGKDKFFVTAYRESNVENRFKVENSLTLRWLHEF
tara:strand:+ start:4039 stop:5046 length:1008 start_codon:yes stop_codon:yes gene_type:complete